MLPVKLLDTRHPLFARATFLLASLVVLLSSASRAAYACPDINKLVDANCDGKIVLVAFGDSITAGYHGAYHQSYPERVRRYFKRLRTVNLGRIGETTEEGLRRISSALKAYKNADIVVIMEGVNDYREPGHSVAQTADNLYEMVEVAEKATKGIVLLSTLTAWRSSGEDAWIRPLNEEIKHSAALDFHSLGTGVLGHDGLHPEAIGYRTMAKYLAKRLPKLLNARRPPDTDGDGIYDRGERRFKTDRLNPDTDGDGFLDGEEVFELNTDPLVPNG